MMIWFNYRTQEYESGAVCFRDMIPQTDAALGLFDALVATGRSEADASLRVLLILAGAPVVEEPQMSSELADELRDCLP